MAGRSKNAPPKPIPYSALAEVHAAGEREAKRLGKRGPLILPATGERSRALTYKQEEFARLVVSGESHSDAYRKAYGIPDTRKPEYVWSMAWRIANTSQVAQRIKDLSLVKEGESMQNGEAIRSFVLTTLHEIASTGKQEASRVAAASWLGRAPHANLFATQQIDLVDTRALDQVKTELSQRLNSLLPKLIELKDSK